MEEGGLVLLHGGLAVATKLKEEPNTCEAYVSPAWNHATIVRDKTQLPKDYSCSLPPLWWGVAMLAPAPGMNCHACPRPNNNQCPNNV